MRSSGREVASTSADEATSRRPRGSGGAGLILIGSGRRRQPDQPHPPGLGSGDEPRRVGDCFNVEEVGVHLLTG